MADYDFVENDTGSVLRVTCRNKADEDGTPGEILNLTGMTAKLKYRIEQRPLVSVDMTIELPATDGIVTYQFTTNELKPGTFIGEVELRDSGGEVLTSLGLVRREVRKKLS